MHTHFPKNLPFKLNVDPKKEEGEKKHCPHPHSRARRSTTPTPTMHNSRDHSFLREETHNTSSIPTLVSPMTKYTPFSSQRQTPHFWPFSSFSFKGYLLRGSSAFGVEPKLFRSNP